MLMLETAIPAMEDLYAITKKAGFCTAIADNEGYILKRIGAQDELDFTQHGNFIEGANWSEEIMGTNAVGLALVMDKPVQVYAYEHFCKCACYSACSAAPLHNDKGEIIGVLDLTGPYKLANAHTLGMVVAASKAIERTLDLKNVYENISKSKAHKEGILESIIEGLIAVDSHGVITHLNRNAIDYLDLAEKGCIGKKIEDVLDNEEIIDNLFSRSELWKGNIPIKTDSGVKKYHVNTTPFINKDKRNDGSVILLHEAQPLNRFINRLTGAQANTRFEDLIGKCNNFCQAIEQAKMVAETDSNILILGESGVGKDLFAQAIHNGSNRRRQSFLAINCSAIPRDLASSELFGYEEGAFTGAKKRGNPGKFELADRGTIFLDEIGETPPDLQAHLLRVLEDGNIIRLGGRALIPVDVRLICATNKNLPAEIAKGNFRNDLFFRISVITINIPPLRERQTDIPLLAEYFLRRISSRLGKNIKSMKPEVLDILIDYSWPGNVRELQNVIERAIGMAKGDKITLDLLPAEFNGEKVVEPALHTALSKDNYEEQLIRSYMLRFNNKSEIAKALNISRSSLYRKMDKYGIDLM